MEASNSLEGGHVGSLPGGGGKWVRSTGSPRLRASKTASKLCEKEEDQWRRLRLEPGPCEEPPYPAM